MPPRRRKRTKSSPGKESDPSNKKQKHFNKACRDVFRNQESDSDNSLYFDIEEDTSESENLELSQPPPKTSNMAPPISKEDLKEIASIIAQQLKPDLINEIKSELLSEVKRLVKAELAAIEEKHVAENTILQAELASLRNSNAQLSSSLIATQLELDELDQYGRRMCLEISGIAGDTYDNTENVQKKILDHATRAGTTLCAADMDRCHRLGKPRGTSCRKVIVKFTNSAARQRVYQARKTLGHGIFVQENLTRLRQQLGFEARQLVRAQTLEKTWVAGCKVFGSMHGSAPGASKPIHIKDMSVIQAIKDGKYCL